MRSAYGLDPKIGGIKINERTEVIDKKGKTISGLYTVGLDTAGMWGDSYCIKDSTGAATGFVASSSWIAGRNVLRYVGGSDITSGPRSEEHYEPLNRGERLES
jgi:hypothetical protein